GAPFQFVSGLVLSPLDGKAYVTDLGASAALGAIYVIAGGSGATQVLRSNDPLLPDPFALTIVPSGAAGRRLVVVDWDSDPSSPGPDLAGGPGPGALFWVDETTGALTLISDGTNHPSITTILATDSAFDNPVGVAY